MQELLQVHRQAIWLFQAVNQDILPQLQHILELDQQVHLDILAAVLDIMREQEEVLQEVQHILTVQLLMEWQEAEELLVISLVLKLVWVLGIDQLLDKLPDTNHKWVNHLFILLEMLHTVQHKLITVSLSNITLLALHQVAKQKVTKRIKTRIIETMNEWIVLCSY